MGRRTEEFDFRISDSDSEPSFSNRIRRLPSAGYKVLVFTTDLQHATHGPAWAAESQSCSVRLPDGFYLREPVLLDADLHVLCEHDDLHVELIVGVAAEVDALFRQVESARAVAVRLHGHRRALQAAGAGRLDGQLALDGERLHSL